MTSSSFLDHMTPVRREVFMAIMDVMAAAEEHGLDPVTAAQRAFPGTPGAVIIQARYLLRQQRTAAWWDSVERTIDGEVIRNAIVKAGPA